MFFFFSRRSRHRCWAATFQWTTNTSSRGAVTRRPLCTKSYTEPPPQLLGGWPLLWPRMSPPLPPQQQQHHGDVIVRLSVCMSSYHGNSDSGSSCSVQHQISGSAHAHTSCWPSDVILAHIWRHNIVWRHEILRAIWCFEAEQGKGYVEVTDNNEQFWIMINACDAWVVFLELFYCMCRELIRWRDNIEPYWLAIYNSSALLAFYPSRIFVNRHLLRPYRFQYA